MAEFGPRLPFLLKVLAAETPLSLQVHPTLAQAREGFAREEAAGVDPAATERNYKDAFHKPEMILALTPFEALCGFRPAAESRAVFLHLAACFELAGLELPALVPAAARGPGAAGRARGPPLRLRAAHRRRRGRLARHGDDRRSPRLRRAHGDARGGAVHRGQPQP